MRMLIKKNVNSKVFNIREYRECRTVIAANLVRASTAGTVISGWMNARKPFCIPR
jgi:hypothetical protein